MQNNQDVIVLTFARCDQLLIYQSNNLTTQSPSTIQTAMQTTAPSLLPPPAFPPSNHLKHLHHTVSEQFIIALDIQQVILQNLWGRSRGCYYKKHIDDVILLHYYEAQLCIEPINPLHYRHSIANYRKQHTLHKKESSHQLLYKHTIFALTFTTQPKNGRKTMEQIIGVIMIALGQFTNYPSLRSRLNEGWGDVFGYVSLLQVYQHHTVFSVLTWNLQNND